MAAGGEDQGRLVSPQRRADTLPTPNTTDAKLSRSKSSPRSRMVMVWGVYMKRVLGSWTSASSLATLAELRVGTAILKSMSALLSRHARSWPLLLLISNCYFTEA